jgi:hypothetical protein
MHNSELCGVCRSLSDPTVGEVKLCSSRVGNKESIHCCDCKTSWKSKRRWDENIKIDLKEVDETGSESCPVAGFVISNIKIWVVGTEC